jgi:hypothetical protein
LARLNHFLKVIIFRSDMWLRKSLRKLSQKKQQSQKVAF